MNFQKSNDSSARQRVVFKAETDVSDIHHIQRGYENIVEKFSNLGAKIDYIKTEDEDE